MEEKQNVCKNCGEERIGNNDCFYCDDETPNECTYERTTETDEFGDKLIVISPRIKPKGER